MTYSRDAHCQHVWTPTPSNAASAVALVGVCMCLKCHRTATKEDMQRFGAAAVEDAQSGGHVMHEHKGPW